MSTYFFVGFPVVVKTRLTSFAFIFTLIMRTFFAIVFTIIVTFFTVFTLMFMVVAFMFMFMMVFMFVVAHDESGWKGLGDGGTRDQLSRLRRDSSFIWLNSNSTT